MQQNARETYLKTQVETASPQKLRLMLIQGAIRVTRQTIDHWQNERIEEGAESLIRSREIISELLSGVKPQKSSISKSTSEIYMFLFQSLTMAQQDRSLERLDDVIKVLEVERETWQKVCEDLPEAPASTSQQTESSEITADAVVPSQQSSISFDA